MSVGYRLSPRPHVSASGRRLATTLVSRVEQVRLVPSSACPPCGVMTYRTAPHRTAPLTYDGSCTSPPAAIPAQHE